MRAQNSLPQHVGRMLNTLADVCFQASADAGWWEPNPKLSWGDPGFSVIRDEATPTKLCLIHSEVSEAMEGFRKGVMDDHLLDRTMFEVELADVLIRVFDLAGAHDLDLGGALLEKFQYNQRRADHKPEARASEGGKKF